MVVECSVVIQKEKWELRGDLRRLVQLGVGPKCKRPPPQGGGESAASTLFSILTHNRGTVRPTSGCQVLFFKDLVRPPGGLQLSTSHCRDTGHNPNVLLREENHAYVLFYFCSPYSF